ncbi:hypothetical protein FQN60_006038, partial [Etheostoma spectabile]
MKDRRELKSSGNTKITFVGGTACLEISPVSKSDGGDYLCKASNASGSDFCKARVTVKDKGAKAPPSEAPAQPAAAPPKRLDNLFFIEELQNVSAPEKGTATFIAKIGGDPIPSVKWMKGKWRQITAGGRITIEHKGQDARMEIREVTKSDAGQYRCVAANKHGEIESSADMAVAKKEEAEGLGDIRTRLKRTPSKQKSPKKEGDVDIVDLLRGHDPKEYEKILTEHGIHDYRAILQADVERGGRVEEEDMARLMQQLEGRVATEPVSVLEPISDQKTPQDQTATFECKIRINYPEITLSWYKGTQKLESSDKYDIGRSGDRHYLSIRNCQDKDQGNYRVVCGPHIANAKLTVTEVRQAVEEIVERTQKDEMRQHVPEEPEAKKTRPEVTETARREEPPAPEVYTKPEPEEQEVTKKVTPEPVQPKPSVEPTVAPQKPKAPAVKPEAAKTEPQAPPARAVAEPEEVVAQPIAAKITPPKTEDSLTKVSPPEEKKPSAPTPKPPPPPAEKAAPPAVSPPEEKKPSPPTPPAEKVVPPAAQVAPVEKEPSPVSKTVSPPEDGKPTEEAPKGRGRGLGARQTPSPGDGGKGRGLRPGGKGPSPPEEPFGGFKLKAVPLKFVKKIQDIVLQEAESIGSSAVFECEISPSTAITTWMKDGSNLREGPKHKFTADGKDRKLNIIDVQLSDTGEYTCVGKNAGKEVTCTAKLVVEELPVKWLKELEPETSCIKTQPMYLTCELNKERDVVWKRNGALLKKQAGKVAINVIGMQHAVTIQNATEQDAGAYTCEVAGQED